MVSFLNKKEKEDFLKKGKRGIFKIGKKRGIGKRV